MTNISKAFLDQINAFAKDISSITTWSPSGDAFGHIYGKTADDYVFEFYCYIKILHDLRINQDIRFVKGNNKKVFPKKPRAKNEGWSRFDIHGHDGNRRYQVCSGTGIQLTYAPETVHHPDISFQKSNAPDTPDENDVVLVMDAKYTTKKNGGIDLQIIKEFLSVVISLKLDNSPALNVQFDKLTELDVNCLLTNGGKIDKHDKYCSTFKIKQISKFDKL